MNYHCEPGGGPRHGPNCPFPATYFVNEQFRQFVGVQTRSKAQPGRATGRSASWARHAGIGESEPTRCPAGCRLSAACEGGPGTIRNAPGRGCVGRTQALAASGQCVDGHARNCYSDHPVGTASQRPSDCRRRLSSRAICPEQSFGHPAPTPAVVVCARSLLENGRDESQKPVRAIHTYFCTFGLYVN
jgi:hypothetical protein